VDGDRSISTRSDRSPWAIRLLLLAVIATVFCLAGPGPADAEAGDALLDEYMRRRAECGGNLVAHRELGDWARQQGLLGAAEAEYRAVLAANPDDERAYDALFALCDSRRLTRQSEAFDAARSVLGASFRTYETRRYVVLSDADPVWTRTQSERLERTHHQFHRFARRIGLRPLPLQHKLVCVLFEDRADYQRFARAQDDVMDPWIAGYYAPVPDRVVFYHGKANPSVVAARVRLDEMADDVDSISRELADAMRGGRKGDAEALHEYRQRYQQHLRRERVRVDTFTEQVNIATTVHEAVHQLLFHTRVQSVGVHYPVWISEGLATTFETGTTSSAFGPDHEYEPRREAFDELLAKDGLLDLEAFVAWLRLPNDEDVVHAAYHQSYALVTWMSRYRRNELRHYLEQIRREMPGELSEARARSLFEGSFGSIAALERAWLRAERNR
jgi:hypothetical protein